MIKKLVLVFLIVLSLVGRAYCGPNDGWFSILQEASDVDKTPPTNGQVLMWDSTLLLWVPTTLTTSSVSNTAYGIYWADKTTLAPSMKVLYDVISGLGGGHDAVTLSAALQNFLGLSTQELGFAATPTLPNGTIATTQTTGDNSTKVATTAYVVATLANAKTDIVPFTFKPYGTGVTINTLCTKPIAYAGTITKVEIESDTSGSIEIEVYKSSTASPDQRVYSKISASAPMTLSTAYQSSDSTLTGWTKTVAAGDTLQLKVTSATAGNPVGRVQAKVFITRT